MRFNGIKTYFSFLSTTFVQLSYVVIIDTNLNKIQYIRIFTMEKNFFNIEMCFYNIFLILKYRNLTFSITNLLFCFNKILNIILIFQLNYKLHFVILTFNVVNFIT